MTSTAVHVVTGATRGIGRALAERLAAEGGTIVLVGRDQARTETARSQVAASSPAATVAARHADLALMADVGRLGRELAEVHPRITSVVNCAAVYASHREVTAEGLELMFATNHLAPFLLTNLLMPALRASGAARVLTFAAPSTVKLDFDDLQGKNRFRSLTAFGATKTANLLFTFELARRTAGSGVTANAVHPGLARTDLMRQSPLPLRAMVGLVSAPPERVAERIAPVVLDEEYAEVSGQFLKDGKTIDPPPYTRDAEVQGRLWEVSERLTGLA